MKQKRNVREILQSANEETARQIAELCPPVDERTRERIFTRTQERLQNTEQIQSETFHVTTVHRPLWRKFPAAAACLAVVAGAVGGTFLLQRYGSSRPESPLEYPATSEMQQTDAETAASTEQEAAPALTETTEWTQEEVYALCMNTVENLRSLGRTSFLCDVDYQFSTDHTMAEPIGASAYFDFVQDWFYTGCFINLYHPNGTTSWQETLWYYTHGYDLELIAYEYSDPIAFYRENAEFDISTPADFVAQPYFLTQEMLGDYSQWEITGTELFENQPISDPDSQTVLDRECIVLEGNLEGCDTSIAGDAVTFRLKVDVQTGMWLDLECYDAEGTIVGFIRTRNLKFGSDAEEPPSPYKIGILIKELGYDFDTDVTLPEIFTTPENTET